MAFLAASVVCGVLYHVLKLIPELPTARAIALLLQLGFNVIAFGTIIHYFIVKRKHRRRYGAK